MNDQTPNTIPQSKYPCYADLPFQERVKRICSDFGLYGNVYLFRPSPIEGSSRNKVYLVASRDPRFASAQPPADFDPEFYLRRNLRSDRLFYTDVFVYDLSRKNPLEANEQLLEYCKYTEHLSTLYDQYGAELPDKVRRFEIRQLLDAREKQRRSGKDAIQRKSSEALSDYFNKEKKGGKQKEWLDFFRSDKHPDDAGVLEKLRAFKKGKESQEISLEQLMECNGDIKTLEMQEHEFKRFADFMNSAYPTVPYAVSKKAVINNGAGPFPPELEAEYGKRVTGEEYDRIKERNFADQSWECIIGMTAAYFEVRKVYFVDTDEPYIASAFHDANTRFARRDSLQTIKDRGGDLRLHKIPTNPETTFMNFVSLAKANGLPFYLDNLGWYETPSLDNFSVIYSSRDEELMADILDRIMFETIDLAHIVPENERPLRPQLQEILNKATQHPKTDTPMLDSKAIDRERS